jgi:dihydrofolate reductase
VIGGKSIYELFMPYADCLVVSIVKGSFECDTFMNKIDENSFHLRSTITNEEFDVKIYDRN